MRGKQQTSPLMALSPGLEYAQSQPHGCCSTKKPYQACRRHEWFAAWLSTAKDPSRFIATGEYLLIDAFVAGHHGLGREPLLDPGPHRVGIELTQPVNGGGHLLDRLDDEAGLAVGHHLGGRPVGPGDHR